MEGSEVDDEAADSKVVAPGEEDSEAVEQDVEEAQVVEGAEEA